MDSKDVNRELRRVIRPALRGAGFSAFTERTSWRHFDDWTWCINFQSFNSYLAEGVGCTSFSFAVNLGLYLRRPMSADAGVSDRPRESQCTFRFNGRTALSQPVFHAWGRSEASERRDIWFVAADGSNLVEVVGDACAVIVGPGLGQLRAYQDPLYAYCSLFDYTRTWPPRRRYELIDVTPCGAADSPAWNEVVTALGPMVGRDPTRDRVTGLPDDLVDAVLAPHVPPPEIPVAVPDVPPRRLDRFRRVLRRF